MSYILHPLADAEFAEAISFYSSEDAALGIRFYQEIERLLWKINEQPLLYRRFDPPARRAISRDFPYAVVFVEEGDNIFVLAIMHLHQEPGYWRTRLRGSLPTKIPS